MKLLNKPLNLVASELWIIMEHSSVFVTRYYSPLYPASLQPIWTHTGDLADVSRQFLSMAKWRSRCRCFVQATLALVSYRSYAARAETSLRDNYFEKLNVCFVQKFTFYKSISHIKFLNFYETEKAKESGVYRKNSIAKSYEKIRNLALPKALK